MSRIITLTTDFGQSDHYVGAMKGVILQIAPDAVLVDISHEFAAQDVLAGAICLEAAAGCFPRGTIHLAVIDPGVGTERAAVAIECERSFYVGPDNGIFSLALIADPMRRAVRLDNPHYHRQPVSATFHGRDLFAPAAAYLASGIPLRALGTTLDSLVSLELSGPVETAAGLQAHVIHVDRFGNVVTDLLGTRFAIWRAGMTGRFLVDTGQTTIEGIATTYGDVGPGSPVAYFGSTDRFEVAVRNGSAAASLGLRAGDVITIRHEV